MQAKGIMANMALQAMVSAASPLRKMSPEVASPTAQLVSIRLRKSQRDGEAQGADIEAEEGRGDGDGRHEPDQSGAARS